MICPQRVCLRNFGSWKSLDFPLADQGLVLLTGPTGSGKSTIFRAIFWCLFGKTPEGHRVSDLCRHGADNCAVRFEFTKVESRQEQTYIITRFRNHPRWKNKVRIMRGKSYYAADEDSLVEDVQPIIERLLGFGPEVFAKVFYFVQRDTNRFSTMTDLERKTFLESLTHGHMLQQFEQAARKKVQDLDTRVRLLEERQRAREETLKVVQTSSEEHVFLLQAQLTNLKIQEREARDNLQKFRRKHEDSMQTWYDLSASLQSKINFHERAIESLKKLAEVCPVCAGAVSQSQRKSRTQDLSASLIDFREQHDKFEQRINEYEDLRDKVAHIEGTAARTRQRLKEAQETRMQPTQQLAEWAGEDAARQVEMQEEMVYNQYWVKGFGPQGLRAFLLARTVQQVTASIGGYLAMIDPSLTATFHLKDNRVIFLGDQGRSLATLSGGERQALDLAVGLSLRNLLEQSTETLDSLILDEPFEGLDSFLQVSCQRILYALPKKSVFLVTHTGFLAKFSKEYEVSKVKGVSRLEVIRGMAV